MWCTVSCVIRPVGVNDLSSWVYRVQTSRLLQCQVTNMGSSMAHMLLHRYDSSSVK